MSDIGIFVLGLMVTIVTVTAVILVGRAEAQDPALNRTGHGNDGG
jgi:hypothetical protein